MILEKTFEVGTFHKILPANFEDVSSMCLSIPTNMSTTLHWPGCSCIYNVLLALMLPFKLYLLNGPCQMHIKLSSFWQNSTAGNYQLLLQRASFQMLQGS